jgi:phosphoserine aminotransferase
VATTGCTGQERPFKDEHLLQYPRKQKSFSFSTGYYSDTFSQGADAAQKEKAFLSGATQIGLLGLKGHRSVGGIRASNYNSVSLEGAQKLVEYLKQFAASN